MRKYRTAKAHPKQTTVKNENITLNTFSLAPISSNTIAISLCILSLITMSETCQHGHMRNSIDLVCTEKQQCSYEFSREILFNKLQKDLCVSIRHQNRTVGTIEVRNKQIVMSCSKRTRFYTRDTRPYVYSAVRCPQAGSCTQGACARLRSNDTVIELIRESLYPGYSGCESSCGGIACGCLLPLPACSFYRVAHVPRNQQVYEVIDCSEWKPSVHIEIAMNIYNKAQQKDMILQPYVTKNRKF